MTTIEKIRAEIERRNLANYCGTAEQYEEELFAILDTLPEQPVEGLEEAADAHIRRVADAVRHRGWDLETQDIAEAFIAGAEWGMNQCPLPEDTTIFLKGVAEGKRLMMDEAEECFVEWYDGLYLNLTTEQMSNAIERAGAKVGDKVKIIIVNREESK